MITRYTKKTSSQLKQTARGLMMGKYRSAISLLLASDLIVSVLSILTTTNSNSYMGIMIGLVFNFVMILFGAILGVGQCSFYLNIGCNGPYQFSDLFTGFKIHPDKTIIMQLIIQILTVLPLLPAMVLMALAVFANDGVIFLFLSCILLIIGAGLSWWISLRYSQIRYLLLDFPDYSAKELMKMSWKLMKGNAGRLLYLQVSFIPLTLAGLLSFGVGLLFVIPYQNMTYTLFYLDLVTDN